MRTSNQLPEGITTFSIQIQKDCKFSDITIRNGYLWGKNTKNQIVYANLNNRINPEIHTFTKIGVCEFYSVTPNGELCYVKTNDPKNPNVILTSESLSTKTILLIPGYTALCAKWVNFKSKPKPYLFIGAQCGDQSLICSFDLNSQLKLSACSPVALDSLDGKILSLNAFQLDNKKILFYILLLKKDGSYILNPGILKENLAPFQEKDTRIITVPLLEFDFVRYPYFMENQNIGVLTPYQFLYNVNDPTSDYDKGNLFNFQPLILPTKEEEPLVDQIPKIPHKIFISNNILLLFMSNSLYIYLLTSKSVENHIDHLKISDDKIYEFDIYSSTLYSLSDDNVITNYQFSSSIAASGFESFSFWLYFRHIKQNTSWSLSAAAIILLQSSATFDQKFNLARNQSDSFRLNVFMQLLESVKETYQLQRTAIATMTLLIYIRKEVKEFPKITKKGEKTTRIRNFIRWVGTQISKGNLTRPIIEKMLIKYNWNEALAGFLQQQASFDLNMQLGQYTEAHEKLKTIYDPKEFAYSSLRLHSHIPDGLVYKDIIERDDAVSGTLIPLMGSEHYQPHFAHLFSSGVLTNHWLQSLFSLYMAKEPDTTLINQYFCSSNDQDSKTDIGVMIRSLLSSKRFVEAAQGICSMKNFEDFLFTAVSVLSTVDPQKAFEIIPEKTSVALKKRCTLHILRSMKKEDAATLAQMSLLNSASEIDIATLIEFMPETTTVGKMSKAIKKYSLRNEDIEKEEEKKSKEALDGINCSNNMVEKKEPQVINLNNYTICEICGRPLLNQPSVYYPCSHAFHRQCATDYFRNKIFCAKPDQHLPPIKLEMNCPFCGFLPIKMIDQSFEPIREPSEDEWETDPNVLSKFLK